MRKLYRNILEILAIFSLVSGLYVVSFFLTFDAIFPFQRDVMPQTASFAMLFFLPHGVRVLSAWLYGWRSVLYIAAGALVTHVWLFQTSAFDWQHIFAFAVGILCAPLAFALLQLPQRDHSRCQKNAQHWQCVLSAAVVASLLNSVATNWALGASQTAALTYLVGDLSGVALLLGCLMMIFRALRKRGL